MPVHLCYLQKWHLDSDKKAKNRTLASLIKLVIAMIPAINKFEFNSHRIRTYMLNSYRTYKSKRSNGTCRNLGTLKRKGPTQFQYPQMK